jgi:hypothetical protein
MFGQVHKIRRKELKKIIGQRIQDCSVPYQVSCVPVRTFATPLIRLSDLQQKCNHMPECKDLYSGKYLWHGASSGLRVFNVCYKLD